MSESMLITMTAQTYLNHTAGPYKQSEAAPNTLCSVVLCITAAVNRTLQNPYTPTSGPMSMASERF